MERYDEKMNFLIEFYGRKCPCGCSDCNMRKRQLSFDIDLHHRLGKSRSGAAAIRQEERHGKFIDSLANLIPVPHNCHISRHSSLPRFTDGQADRMELMMEDGFGTKSFCDILNMICDSTFDETSEALECFLELV